MKKVISISIVSLFMCIISFWGCEDGPSSSDDSGDIEMKGTWAGTVILEGDTIEAVYTFSNTTLDVDWGGLLLSFKVIKYDNDKNFCVFQLTNHPVPEFNNKFMKMAWLNEPSDTVQIRSIDYNDPKDTAEEAENTPCTTDIVVFTRQ